MTRNAVFSKRVFLRIHVESKGVFRILSIKIMSHKEIFKNVGMRHNLGGRRGMAQFGVGEWRGRRMVRRGGEGCMCVGVGVNKIYFPKLGSVANQLRLVLL